MPSRFFLAIVLLLNISTTAVAQDIEVMLPERTMSDDLTAHLEALIPDPSEDLKLPAVDTSGAAYLEIFYSWEAEGNEIVSALVLPEEGGQTFYIDLNNDEDLTNDGEQLFFSYDDNELVFYFQSSRDPEQRTGRVLQRIPWWVSEHPEAGETFLSQTFDEAGNLQPIQRMMWLEHNPGMTGRKHTFFFDERLDVARGEVTIDGVPRLIGLYDNNQDGLFDNVEHPVRSDLSDLLLMDVNGDGRLTRDMPSEFFKLNDVFELEGKRYRLSHIDPYGRRLHLVQTNEPVTEYYVRERDALREQSGARIQGSGELDRSFWDLELTPVEGTLISMAHLKGRYILLNFWGEWCAPCIEEIPVLVEARAAYPQTELVMIGMLKTDDLDAARRVVTERGMVWPQVLVTGELQERFKVLSYPTNILILPDGEHYLRVGGISLSFFERYVR